MGTLMVILGPTAVGKSALGMRLAEQLDGEIVNADALQVYRGFDVGTAKPTAEERRRVRHHLIDILDPHEQFSAGDFARRARQAIEDIGQRSKVPIVVGGSGLYLRALLEGIAEIPPVDPRLTDYLRRRLGAEGLARQRLGLTLLDPETANRLAPGDTQRTLRALAVALGTGRPLAAWIAERPYGRQPLPALRIGLTLPRAILYDRIADRVRSMVQEGWVEEVVELLDRGLSPSLPAFQAIGYRQLAGVARGRTTLEEAIAETIRATTRFAKRQATWHRNEKNITWFSADEIERELPQIVAIWNEFGRRGAYAEDDN
ncbi:MAG: tRNA (adenosine(37)-N6)-dimethylallyltransferase MiaA [Acidobacteria bacterium]|nr:MAG: tRNA (adenosine(37)-N6)-dimethylallyltransferase MiaA [Acidobacteriota bacterium]